MAASTCPAAEPATASTPVTADTEAREVLSPEQWKRVESATDRALAWLASRQRDDGSFPTRDTGQPAVTALCVLAFLAVGNSPGEGRHGAVIDKGIEYVLGCQHPDGLIAKVPPRSSRRITPAQCAAYNHAIGGLMLTEAYGMTSGEVNRRIRSGVEAALAYARRQHPTPKRHPADQGGWRYLRSWQSSDSDLSVTSWNLMFLRSAKNAGFEVPAEVVDESLKFVRSCFNERDHTFWYALRGQERVTTRAMTGAGILSLSLGGQHQTKAARQAGEWLLLHPFDRYRHREGFDRFFYGAFYCSHAMFQLAGRYWTEFYPILVRTLIDNQRPDGSWDVEPATDYQYGNAYSTALSVLALSAPHQLLPVFQR